MPDVYNKFAAITTSDTVDLAARADAVWVGGAGNVAAVQTDGVVVTLTAVAAGTLLPIVVRRINATNTTATNLVALRAV